MALLLQVHALVTSKTWSFTFLIYKAGMVFLKWEKIKKSKVGVPDTPRQYITLEQMNNVNHVKKKTMTKQTQPSSISLIWDRRIQITFQLKYLNVY